MSKDSWKGATPPGVGKNAPSERGNQPSASPSWKGTDSKTQPAKPTGVKG